MQKTFLLVLIAILTFPKAYAQKDSVVQNSMAISMGLSHGYCKDINFSPLNYKISGSNYGLSYSREKINSFFRVSADFNNNKINTIQQTGFPASKYLYGKFMIAYLRKMKKAPNKVDFFLGGQYQTSFNYIDFLEASNSFLIAHSLGVSLSGKFQISNKHTIHSSIELPLVALVVRPPYAGFDEALDENASKPLRLITNGYLTTVNKYLAPSFFLQYEYNMTASFSLLGTYQMDYQKLNKNDRITSVHNQIRVGLNYKF